MDKPKRGIFPHVEYNEETKQMYVDSLLTTVSLALIQNGDELDINKRDCLRVVIDLANDITKS